MISEGSFIRDVGNEGSKIGQKLLMEKSKKLLTCAKVGFIYTFLYSPFLYQFHARIEALVRSSFAND